jgi:putative Holliday junction resolvase
MKYLSLDIGEARVGVAVTDDSGIIATPLTYLEVSHKILAELGIIIAAEKPNIVIFGIPRHQSGEEAAMAAQIRDFAEVVRNEYNVEVDFEDESGTTLEAEKRLAERKVPREQYRQLVDAEAAAVILESYLAGHL